MTRALRIKASFLNRPSAMHRKHNKEQSNTPGMLIKIALMAIFLIFFMEYSTARYDDADGRLEIFWSPPSSGHSVQSYIWSYTINGITDSITGISPSDAQGDSSVTLAHTGDWAVFSIRAISIHGDTSIAAISDTAYFSGCRYVPGDANNSGALNGLDVTYSVNYFRGIGNPPPYTCECTSGNIWFVAGDVNNSCSFNGLDVTYMVNYFKGGPVPQPCTDCPPSQ